MADCRFCGGYAGPFRKEHPGCEQAHAAALLAEHELPHPSTAPTAPQQASRPLNAINIFWAVFFALCAFGLLQAFVEGFIRAVNAP
jgi:hypothetical protein